jgi:hypothetical protein
MAHSAGGWAAGGNCVPQVLQMKVKNPDRLVLVGVHLKLTNLHAGLALVQLIVRRDLE